MDVAGNIKNFFGNLTDVIPTEKIEIGEAAALWYIARNKLIGLSVLEIYLAQAQDVELKALLDIGIKAVAIPHIERIQKLLHKEGVEVPSIHGRTNLDIVGRDTGERIFLKDDEIAISIREIIRLSLMNEYKALVDATRDDIIELVWNIFVEDYSGYKKLVKLAKNKHWLITSPPLQ